MEIVLEMQNICKTFYGDGIEIKANDNVNFTLQKGEIHALLGENGAGKSTLVGALFRKPDSGIIKLNSISEQVELKNPMTALKYGLAIARQDLTKSLVERHSIAENILSISQGFFLSLKTIEKKILQILKDYDLGDLDPKQKVGKLSGGEKQRVEILKALITNPDIIILDEPTAMLTPFEIDNLFKTLDSLRKRGKSIVLITHHLEEAVRFSDRITILRQGKSIETFDTQIAMKNWKTEEEGIRHLANLMVGREVLYNLDRIPLEAGKISLEIKNLQVKNDMDDLAVNNVSLTLQENKILGLAGIGGNGQKELIEAILHLRKVESGQVIIRKIDMTNQNIKNIRNLGVAYIPEDRNKGLIYDLTIRENLMLNSYQSKDGIFIENRDIVSQTEKLMDKFNIKAPSALVPVRTLSGGNKQKVVIAREVTMDPPENCNLIIIAENPTFGLDIGTTHFVREELLKLRSEGAAIFLISSDLSEILALSDEIAVIHKGTIIDSVQDINANRENIGLLMGGTKIS